MRRPAHVACAACVAIAIAITSCAYPDFQFTTDASTSAARVPCGGKGDLCADGEVCCLDHVNTDDVCHKPGECPAKHSELYCNTPTSCPSGLVCCASFSEITIKAGIIPDVIECRSTCAAASTRPTCENGAGCPDGLTCQEMIKGYPGYEICF